jgi:ferredoxin-NADP reductase
MALFSRLSKVPPSASGRSRHDPLLGAAHIALATLSELTTVGRRRPVAKRNSTLSLEVADRRVVARDEDVIALTLVASQGGQLPPWFPGAHIDLHLPSGRVRQYSLNGSSAVRDAYRIAVRRIPDGGGGSIEVHDDLIVGATVTTGGPRNAFPLSVPGYGSPAQRFRFIAGGIGITPILPMLHHAQRLGVEWSMLYTGRCRDSLPFLDEVLALGDRVEIRTDDDTGLPTADDLLGDCPDGTAVYACGPAAMLTAVRGRLAGRRDVELHFERFAAPPVVDGAPFSVCIASTGAVVDVGADETLLSALRRTEVSVPYSCQQGFCGTCRTRVLEGAVDHRDTLLTDIERAAGAMLVCVSRAPDQVTLDL